MTGDMKYYICHKRHIEKVLDKYDMKNCSLGDTLITKGATPISQEQSTERANERYFMCINSWKSDVCSSLYLPDIAYVVEKLDKYMCNLEIDHWKAAKKVMWYL